MLYFQDFWHHEHFSLMLKQTNPELNLYLDTGEQISKQDTVTPFPAQDGEDLNKPEVLPEIIPAGDTSTSGSDVLDIVPYLERESKEETETHEEVIAAEGKATEVEKSEVVKTEMLSEVIPAKSEVEQLAHEGNLFIENSSKIKLFLKEIEILIKNKV